MRRPRKAPSRQGFMYTLLHKSRWRRFRLQPRSRTMLVQPIYHAVRTCCRTRQNGRLLLGRPREQPGCRPSLEHEVVCDLDCNRIRRCCDVDDRLCLQYRTVHFDVGGQNDTVRPSSFNAGHQAAVSIPIREYDRRTRVANRFRGGRSARSTYRDPRDSYRLTC